MKCTLRCLKSERTVFCLVAVLIAGSLSLQAQAQGPGGPGEEEETVCLDPLAWSCDAEYGSTVDGHGCSGGACSDVGGGEFLCITTSTTEEGGAFGGSFTSGVAPAAGSNGKESGAPVYKVCIWQNSCWDECEEVPNHAPACSADYIPPVPWGGFHVTFGADCL